MSNTNILTNVRNSCGYLRGIIILLIEYISEIAHDTLGLGIIFGEFLSSAMK